MLGLTLVFVDQLLFVVDLFSALGSRVGHPLVLKIGNRALAFGDHLADGLALHCLVILVLHVELLLARQVFFDLLFDGGRPLHLGDIHVVAGVLNLLASLFLPLKGLVAAFTPLLLSILCINLLTHETFIVSLPQVDELVCFLRRLLNLLLGLLVLHLKHAYAVAQELDVVLHLIFHAFDIIDGASAWHLRSLLLLLCCHLLFLHHHLLLNVIALARLPLSIIIIITLVVLPS